jgi:3',5'-nucleoside bisphosphate phosphatase
VQAAAGAGVELLALTDHDTVDGVREAARAANRIALGFVTGVELSAIDQTGRDLHILGYLLDDRDPTLLGRLEEYRGHRERRAEGMTQALRKLGFELDEGALRARAKAGKSIGRPHLAAAVVEHPANSERLSAEGCNERSAFLKAYLIDGRPAFRPRQGPSVREAIQTVHDAGGVAVWAHPFWDVSTQSEVLATIDRFRGQNLDGVECFYPTHTCEQATLLADRCIALGMLSTGSADFHGPEDRQFSRFRAFSTYGLEPVLGPISGAA